MTATDDCTGLIKLNPKTSGIPPPRCYHGSCLHQNKLYVFGGKTKDLVYSDFFQLNVRKTLPWKRLEFDHGPKGRFGHGMVSRTKTRTLLLFGGKDRDGGMNDLWEFNSSLLTWKCIKEDLEVDMSTVCSPLYHRFSDSVFLFNGQRMVSINLARNSIHLGNVFPGEKNRVGFTLTWIKKFELMMFGGKFENGKYTNEQWVYSIKDDVWKLQSFENTPSPRAHHSILSFKKSFIIYGGESFSQLPQNILHLFNLASNSWSTLPVAMANQQGNMVGFSLDLIPRRDKAIQAIGFGGWDFQSKECQKCLFSLLDLSTDEATQEGSKIEPEKSVLPKENKTQKSVPQTNTSTPLSDHDRESLDEVPWTKPEVRKVEKLNRQPSWNHIFGDENQSSTLLSQIMSLDIQYFDSDIQHPPEKKDYIEKLESENLKLKKELQETKSKLEKELIKQQESHIFEVQNRELEYNIKVRQSVNMRFVLSQQEAQSLSYQELLSTHQKLVSSLNVTKSHLERSTKCVQCSDRIKSVCFFPCSHLKYCEDCSEKMTHCKICGEFIHQKVSICL